MPLLAHGGFHLVRDREPFDVDVFAFDGSHVLHAMKRRYRFGRTITSVRDNAGAPLFTLTNSVRTMERLVLHTSSGRRLGAFEERSAEERKLDVEGSDGRVLFGLTGIRLGIGDYRVARAAPRRPRRVATILRRWEHGEGLSLIYESRGLSSDERALLLGLAVVVATS